MDINRNNYETFFLLWLDQELNPAERVEVENFLKEHTDLQKEFSLLQHTIQRPAEIVFEQKELLYHTEEKRRVIPIYWTRIAAALVLILAGGLFALSILKNRTADLSVKEQSVAAVDARKENPVAAEKMNPSNQKKNPDQVAAQGQKKQIEIKQAPDHTGQSSSQAVNTSPGQSSTPGSKQKPTTTGHQIKYSGEQKGSDDKNSSQMQNPINSGQQNQVSPDDLAILMSKSNATAELQTSGDRNALVAPGQSLNGAKTPSVLIAVAPENHRSDMENEELADIQTDNSISVIALNDRNKGITGFFKKLTNRASGNETADNTKKLHVSVFQFSY